jgi:putative transposase
MIAALHAEQGYAIRTLCQVLGLAPSSFYATGTEPDDAALLSAIQEVLGSFPTYGSRRLAAQLRRTPWQVRVNRKRLQRVMRVHGLLQARKPRKKRTTNSQHGYARYPNLVKDLQIVRPDQVWVSDITYIRLQHEFVYLALIMDVFTRSIRGWQLSRSLDQELSLTALRRALCDHLPEIHHSDQGVQYAATEYIGLLGDYHVQISMAAVGKSQENPFAERLNRTVKEEEVDLSEYLDFHDAYSQIEHFIEQVYQYKRIHSSLGYLTPAEFEGQWQLKHPPQPLP